MSKVVLDLKNVCKDFSIKRGIFKRSAGCIKAVNNVSFSLSEKETLGLVGESGCGKTTIARAIIRLIDSNKGEIVFNGINLAKISKRKIRPLRQHMQIVFQDPYTSLDPLYKVKDIIAEAILSFWKMDQLVVLDRVKELLELVKLPPDVLYRYPHEFSGGERQRIAIARSLATNPKLLILDEAVSSLDVVIQSQIIRLLLELQEKLGLTYLFISHNLRVIRAVSTKIAVMYLGKIVEMAETEELLNHKLHPYAEALFLAAIEMKSTVAETAEIKEQKIKGCPYSPRCKFAQNICREEEPELKEISGGHMVACHFPLGK